jgi:CMP-N-acetylneuraminic acid synthetase
MGARYTAFIPVRAGSKSIPLKNIKKMAGRPLVHWALKAADECDRIRRIVVSTDSPVIENVVAAFGSPKVEIHHRSAESATDTASTEQVMLEYAGASDDFDALVLIQATSPLLSSDDLQRGIDLFEAGRYDSVLSVVRQKRFVWEADGDVAVPVNYDFTRRPRRQEFGGILVENGAFYVTSRTALLGSECRLSGRIGLVEMDEASYFEIDEPSDWAIVEGLLARVSRSTTDAGDKPEDAATGS